VSRCARLAKIIQTVGKYNIKMHRDPFRSLLEVIIYQQLAGSAAYAMYGRFLKIYGRFPRPEQLLATHDAKLRAAAGLSTRKIEHLKDLSARVSDGWLKLDLLPLIADEEVMEHLVQVNGIGRWTAEMFLIFCLGRPDILPVGNLGLRKAIQKAYSLSELPSPAAIRNIAKAWKPYCSVVS
jgi:DNA-3-methyladenine glycosylase II